MPPSTSLSEVDRCQQQLLAYGVEHHYDDPSGYAPFRILFRMTSAYAGHDLAHLDALLQYCVVLDAVRHVPLPHSAARYRIPLPLESVWQGSDSSMLYHSTSLFPEGSALKRVSYCTKRNDSLGPRFARRKMNGEVWQPDNGSGTHREYLIALPTLATKTLVGYGVGTISEIERLLCLLLDIGKKRSQGFGQFSAIEVTALPPLPPESGYLFLQENLLLRPVPHNALTALGYQPCDPSSLQMVAYAPPYWHVGNKDMGYPEHTRIEPREVGTVGTLALQRWSTPDFLVFCERKEAQRKVAHNGPVDIVFLHPKLQREAGKNTLCAMTGLPIGEGGAVAAKDVLKGEMGNVVDFLKAPDSLWVSPSSALVLSQQRIFHRSFIALVSPDEQDARLLWPTMAVDPTSPQQERPLWCEALLALAEQYLGYRCIIVCKDEPKSRLWPRARQGVIGTSTPLYFSDAELSYADLLFIDVLEAKRQMLLIESWLDKGYTKTAIRTGTLVAPADRVHETLAIQREVEAMRHTSEFLLAWRVARAEKERAKRKGNR